MPQITRLKGTQLELPIKIKECKKTPLPSAAPQRRRRRSATIAADQIPIPFDLFSQVSTKSKRPEKISLILEELQGLES